MGVSNSVPSGVTSATVNISKPNGTPEVYTITGPNFVQGVINAINSNNQSAFTAQIFSTSNGLIKVISKEQGTVNDGSFVNVLQLYFKIREANYKMNNCLCRKYRIKSF